MALTNYKTIKDRKGYYVLEEDRQVFEQEIVKTNFGLNIDDHLEFIVYDSSDNQLPQGDDGKLVRYIPLTDDNIRKYLIVTTTNQTKKKNDAFEFIVDVEKLIKEAGYSNGIFKSSVSIVNRRVGKESPSDLKSKETFDNKLWIQQISPSRTEIRVLPIKRKGKVNSDLDKRYSIITRNSSFRDDTIYYIKEFIESVKLENILRNFITGKGKVESGQNYINLVKREFGINNFEDFVRRIHDNWVESIIYYSENKEWRVNSLQYGQPLSDPIDVELGGKSFIETCRSSLIFIIEKYLPKREYTPRNILTSDELQTFDKVRELLKTIRDTTKQVSSSEIEYLQPQVLGCTDPNALNYNIDSTVDDGSCKYSYENVQEPPVEPQQPVPSPPPPPEPEPPLPPPTPVIKTKQTLFTNKTRNILFTYVDKEGITQRVDDETPIRTGRYDIVYRERSINQIRGEIIPFVPEIITETYTNATRDILVRYKDQNGVTRKYDEETSIRTAKFTLTYQEGTLEVVRGKIELWQEPIPQPRPIPPRPIETGGGSPPIQTGGGSPVTPEPPVTPTVPPPLPPTPEPPAISQPPVDTCGDLVKNNLNPENIKLLNCNDNRYVWNIRLNRWVLVPKTTPRPQTETKTFYVWSTVGSIRYSDVNGQEKTIRGTEYQEITITYRTILNKIGDIRETKKVRPTTPPGGSGGGRTGEDVVNRLPIVRDGNRGRIR